MAHLAEALGPNYGLMVHLGAVLGLRWGECAGLRVGLIDFDRSTVAVTEQVTRAPEDGRSSAHPSPRPPGEPWPSRLSSQISSSSISSVVGSQPETLMLSCFEGCSGGEHLDYSNWLHRIWYPARHQAGVVWTQYHDLRRAKATGLVLEGIDLETAQTRLGHTDPRLTLGIYAQASTGADRHAADRLGDRFLPRRGHDRGRGLI